MLIVSFSYFPTIRLFESEILHQCNENNFDLLNVQQLARSLYLRMSVEWSRKLKLIKRLYQFQKLMPHINYFRSLSLSVSLFTHCILQSFFFSYIYTQTVLFVRETLIVIFCCCNFAFYQHLYHIQLCKVRYYTHNKPSPLKLNKVT